jgi:phosphatidylserine decarboxylase
MLTDSLKLMPHYLLPKQAMTTLAGMLADVETPWLKNYLIHYFIRKYHVNMAEALQENPESYACFNDFFIRQLKPGARPIANADLISPVDGCISEIGDINQGKLIQAKNRYYSVEELLACDNTLSSQFAHGRFMTIYLSPKDYHRVHMPIQGSLDHMIHVPGRLFSVQPLTTRLIPHLFARNERLVVYFNTKVGLLAMVMVGATIVGSIGTSWHGDVIRNKEQQQMNYQLDALKSIQLQQGAEMGYFKLGSTVILLFAEGKRMQWNPSLNAGSIVQLGMDIGRTISA